MEVYLSSRKTLQDKDSAFLRLPTLSEAEHRAEERLKQYRKDFLAEIDESNLKEFWVAKDRVANTSLYEVLKAMPKGAMLHAHLGATVPARWVLDNIVINDLTYYHPTLGFKVPKHGESLEGWSPIRQHIESDPNYEASLLSELSLEASDIGKPSRVIWQRFQGLFNKTFGLLNYSEFASMYFAKSLEIFHKDNVNRIELRLMPELTFNKDGALTFIEELELISKVVSDFQAEHPDFSVGLIYCSGKWHTPDKIKSQALAVYEAMKLHPGLVIGYDLVGEEETLHQNLHYAEIFQEVVAFARSEGNEFPFFFHAGETNSSNGENLYDAVLLNTKRIGHGFALAKFPALLEEVRQRKICVECCPISNYILGYVPDITHHPSLTLHRHGIDITICPDDPGMFGYSGVTHDFLYVYCLWDLSLADLKKFILNSLDHCTDPHAKSVWERKWQVYIEWLLTRV